MFIQINLRNATEIDNTTMTTVTITHLKIGGQNNDTFTKSISFNPFGGQFPSN